MGAVTRVLKLRGTKMWSTVRSALSKSAQYGPYLFFALPNLLLASFVESLVSGALLVCLWIFARYRTFGESPGVPLLFALGALAPLLPVFGSQCLPLFVFGALASEGIHGAFRRSAWAMPILLLFLGFLLCDLVVAAWHAGVWYHAVQIVGAEQLRRSLHTVLLAAFPSYESAARLISFIFLIGFFEHYRAFLRSFRLGLVWGSLFACGYTIFEVLGVLPSLVTAQPEFWHALHRVAGTFTDPNAAGVFLAIAIAVGAPLYRLGKEPRSWRLVLVSGVSIVVVVLAGLFSGSRSFLLGIAVLMMGWLYLLSRRVLVVGIGLVVVGIAMISVLDSTTTLISDLTAAPWAPEGITRVVGSVALGRYQESFASRAVFLTMALDLIRSAPVFGIGPGQFRYFVPAVAEQQGLGMNGWTDNSNNFYLGWIAEVGLLGGVLLLLSISGRNFGCGGRWGKVGLFTVVVLLVTGPHLDFLEVAILVAFLFAEQSEVAVSILSARVRRSLSLLALLSGFVAATSRERGVYGWEKEGGGYHQWLSPVAMLSARCSCDGFLRLKVQSIVGSIAHPATVRLSGEGIKSTELEFSSPALRSVVVPCFSVPEATIDFTPPRLLVNVTTDRAWIPARRFGGENRDARVLAVRIRDRRSSDLLNATRCQVR